MNNPRELKRERLRSFIADRRSHKKAPAEHRVAVDRRQAAEKKVRSDAGHRADKRREVSGRRAPVREPVAREAAGSLRFPLRSERGWALVKGSPQSDSGEEDGSPSAATPAAGRRARRREDLRSYLAGRRAESASVLAREKEKKAAAARDRAARLKELERQKESARRQKSAAAAALLAQRKELQARKEEEARQARLKQEQEAAGQKEARRKEAQARQQELSGQKVRKEAEIAARRQPAQPVTTTVKKPESPRKTAEISDRQEKRRQLLAYLNHKREESASVLAREKEKKAAAARDRAARLKELERQKESARRQKSAAAAALLAQRKELQARKEEEARQARLKQEQEAAGQKEARRKEAQARQQELSGQKVRKEAEIAARRQPAQPVTTTVKKPESPRKTAEISDRQEKRRQLLAYLNHKREESASVLAREKEKKAAAARDRAARLKELERQKESARRQKSAAAAALLAQRKELQARKEEEARQARLKQEQEAAGQKEVAGAALPAEVTPPGGRELKRRQLLAYLNERRAGARTLAARPAAEKPEEEFGIPSAGLAAKEGKAPAAAEAVILPIIAVQPPAAPEEVAPVREEAGAVPPPEAPTAAAEVPAVAALETPAAAAGATVVAAAEKAAEKPAGRRLRLPLKGRRRGAAPGEEPAAVPAIPAAVEAKVAARPPFRVMPFLKSNYIRIIFGLLVLAWVAEIMALNKHLDSVRQQVEQASSIARPHAPTLVSGGPAVTPIALSTTKVEGMRDPFSNELWRIQEISPAQVRTVRVSPVRIPSAPSIIKPISPILIARPAAPEFAPPEVQPIIPESAKLPRIPQITVPQVGQVPVPAAPSFNLRFRGILNVAGIDYFFIEGAGGGYRVRAGDTVEGFKIYDYRNGTLFFSRDGYTYQLNEERTSPPLRYRGRMIMAGQEYFFLEGQRTYRVVVGDEVEGYRLVKRVGDYLYFVKDDRLYYLKQE